MKDFDKQLVSQQIEDGLVLFELRKIIGEDKYKDLMEYLGDCGGTGFYKIVGNKNIIGNKQEEDYWFKYVYIKQECGCCGDDYSGVIFIPIGKNKYFKFYYEC